MSEHNGDGVPGYLVKVECIDRRRTATFRVEDPGGKTLHQDRVRTGDDKDRRRAARAVAKKLGLEDVEAVKAQIEQALYAHQDAACGQPADPDSARPDPPGPGPCYSVEKGCVCRLRRGK
jgi:hypothetical protein